MDAHYENQFIGIRFDWPDRADYSRWHWLEAWQGQMLCCQQGQSDSRWPTQSGIEKPAPRCGKTIRREQHYFADQAGRLNCQTLARRGWPIGSGAVESACRSRQGRCKGRRQFWTRTGLRHLEALTEARDHGHWDELLLTACWWVKLRPLNTGAS